MRRLTRAALAVAALAAVGGAIWLTIDSIGWTAMPAQVPHESQTLDARYAQAAAQAEEHLVAARRKIGAAGLSAAVSINGQVVWAGASGWADVAQNRALKTDTIFRVGSTSKAITATLLARMVDAGEMQLDAPIRNYMPMLPNPEWQPLTPRQLASHTAGLAGYEGNRDAWGIYQMFALQKHYDDVIETLEVFDDTSLIYKPGTDFYYSSFDVQLLSAVMQTRANEPFLPLLKRRVLDPLHMASTSGDTQPVDAQRLATFHEVRNGRAKPWRHVDLSQRWAGGGMLSTSSDLARLCGGWYDPAFIRPATVATFWEPQRVASGKVNMQGYAIGWRARPISDALGTDRKTSRYHHGGITKGAMSWLVCYPEQRLGIALNINSLADDFEDLASQEPAITRLFFDAAAGVGKAASAP